jgi:hypothetical protein
MYKSKYSNLIQHLMNEHDLILLDSEQQEIEKWVDKDLKAIDVIHCCESDREQLSRRPNTSSTWECFSKEDKEKKGNI